MGTGVPAATVRPSGLTLMWRRPRTVASWLTELGEPVKGPLVIRRIGMGQSNITSLVTDTDGREWILREPPLAARHGAARDVNREAHIMSALAGTGFPVPRVVGIGAGCGAFFAMERVAGAPLANEDDVQHLRPCQRYELGVQVIKTLARLHRLDPELVWPAAPRSPYVERKIGHMSDAWVRVGSAGTHDAAWRAVRTRLLKGHPPSGRNVVVHGDFRLSNLMVSDGEIAAVVDWELSTVGDPLADLSWLLDDWRSPDEPPIGMPSPTRAGGFPARSELIDIYRNETGFSIDRLGYYRGFTQWCAASQLQAVLARRHAGLMEDHGLIDPGRLDDSIAMLLTSAAIQLKE